jgi:hypothetical protein
MAFNSGACLQFAICLAQASPSSGAASARILAAVVLVGMICGLLYVLRHLRTMKIELGGKNEATKRDRYALLIFAGCTIIFFAACLLLYRLAWH